MNEKNDSQRALRTLLAGALSVVATFVTFAAFANETGNLPDPDMGRPYAQIDRYQPRFGRLRPLIAVVGENSGTELIDFVIPYGVLSQSGAADVLAVATRPGPMKMLPALRIEPQTTIEQFDQRYPDGADYVIVPAVTPKDKKAESILVSWIQAQASKGASIVSICDGALVVAKAGLFKGHRATGHWATQARRERDFPETTWLRNTRYVADGKVLSSAGVTAAIPLSLALIEAIAGTDRAALVAKDIGVERWNGPHDSEQFHLSLSTYLLAIRNMLSPHRVVGLPIATGVDEIALAVTADAHSRTYRSHVYTVASSADVIQGRNGLTVLPDRVIGAADTPRHLIPAIDVTPSALVLDRALADIGHVYGRSTAKFVALQLEYPSFQK